MDKKIFPMCNYLLAVNFELDIFFLKDSENAD